jgi:hypothetical protein
MSHVKAETGQNGDDVAGVTEGRPAGAGRPKMTAAEDNSCDSFKGNRGGHADRQ